MIPLIGEMSAKQTKGCPNSENFAPAAKCPNSENFAPAAGFEVNYETGKLQCERRGRRLDDPLFLPLMREVAFAVGKRRRERNGKISPPVKCYAFDSPL